jgi:threonine dehydrogenase-like Zn-dependent dehydrogenase
VEVARPRDGDTIAVFGPRKLGMLIVAALAARRRRHRHTYQITAIVRREALGDLARACGADRVLDSRAPLPAASADIVFETTGNPAAMPVAIALARRELHLKSTHGRPAAGLSQLTALVVDELAIGHFPESAAGLEEVLPRDGTAGPQPPLVAWLSRGTPPAWLRTIAEVRTAADPADLLRQIESGSAGARPLRADVAVVDDAAMLDAVVRPVESRQVSLVRPRGTILLTSGRQAASGSALVDEVVRRNLRVGSSRCGRLTAALELMDADADLVRLCDRLITHEFGGSDLNAAFGVARSTECLKALVVHRS